MLRNRWKKAHYTPTVKEICIEIAANFRSDVLVILLFNIRSGMISVLLVRKRRLELSCVQWINDICVIKPKFKVGPMFAFIFKHTALRNELLSFFKI